MGLTEQERSYWEHYSKHIEYVALAWLAISQKLVESGLLTTDEFNKANKLIIWHDQSKISPEEWVPYERRFDPNLEQTPEVKANFKAAVKTHKSRNPHHWETLRTYTGDDWRCYVVELVCDYIAMGWELKDYVLAYYDRRRDEINLPPEYKEYLDSVMNILREPEMMEIVEREMTPELQNTLEDTITEITPPHGL